MIFVLHYVRFFCVVSVFVVSVFSSCFVYATESTLRITEIMYDAEGSDTGKEFVEVINGGSEAVAITAVTFFERNDRQRGRAVASGAGNATLQPGEVAVIVSDPALFSQHYSFDGLLLDTTNFALLNAGSTVSLRKGNTLLHSITYTTQHGARGDGNTLHIDQNDVITAGKPSPGVLGAGVAAVTGGTTVGRAVETETPSSTEEEGAGLVTSTEILPQAGTPQQVVMTADPSVVFSASTTKFSVVRQEGAEEEVLYGLWNFGDGGYVYGTVVEHAYLHPGAYIIVFQELLDENGTEGIVLQKEIPVLFPQVRIERVDDAFVRLHNYHPFVLDVSGWRVEAQGVVFDFHEKSFVPKQGSTVIPFAIAPEQDIFFVTAGGGQFNGKPVDSSAAAAQEQEVVPAESEKILELEGEEVEQHASEADTDSTTDVSQESEKAGAGVFVAEVDDDQEEEQTGVAMQMIIVWVALLIGVMTIALVPLILARREKEKRYEHR
ncbi:MAG: lamin tail domain-containing protein [Candidatus Kaiserbacteria bacterium]|nr:lamin tail domain-containing protein [Candidatus Kaiserbacteria bacterium]